MFAFSALFAGLAGGLYAINYEIVTSFNLGVQASGVVLLMTYIGGVGHFVGPILGAALITFLQVSLGNYTEAWLLYLGLLFVAMVMFAPDGLAGLLLRHGPLVRAGVLHRLIPGYATAVVPMALLLFGIVCMVEMGWRLSVQADKGPEMQLLFVPLNALSVGSWLLAFAAFVLGAAGLRLVGPRVGRIWQDLAPAR